MSEPDRSQLDHDLSALAHFGEEHSGTGRPADEVRRAGSRRRQRRTSLVVAVTVAAVALGGGAVFAGTVRSGIDLPAPAQSPTATPAPARTVTTANLLTTGDIATQTSEQRVVVVDPATDAGRFDQASACLSSGRDPRTDLGALTWVGRAFTIQAPGATGPKPRPAAYSLALQFGSDAAAQEAAQTYEGWLAGCRTVLPRAGYTWVRGPIDWIDVRTGVTGTQGRFTEVVYRSTDDANDGWFESTGITRRDDRLMVTVSLTNAPEKYAEYEQFPTDRTMPAHEQFGLVIAAAKRLG